MRLANWPNAINDMSIKIGQNEKTQTEFISSVSHELRTPLTAITGWGETLISAETMDQQEVRRGIATILKESRRLTRMVEELLEFTRLQDGRFTLNVELCDRAQSLKRRSLCMAIACGRRELIWNICIMTRIFRRFRAILPACGRYFSTF